MEASLSISVNTRRKHNKRTQRKMLLNESEQNGALCKTAHFLLGLHISRAVGNRRVALLHLHPANRCLNAFGCATLFHSPLFSDVSMYVWIYVMHDAIYIINFHAFHSLLFSGTQANDELFGQLRLAVI